MDREEQESYLDSIVGGYWSSTKASGRGTRMASGWRKGMTLGRRTTMTLGRRTMLLRRMRTVGSGSSVRPRGP